MKRIILLLFMITSLYGQSPSFLTYTNPIIPGDHPDPTLTKIGEYFYTSGSSFNPTPKIYRSTDLVHWEVIAQPVKSSWSVYGDEPGGGIWGGHMVLYNDIYWHYFGRGGGAMYFVTANQPEGPWSDPIIVNVPASMPAGLGVDNSIFIDEDGKWYMLTKAGQENNHIVELGDDGQPTGNVLDLTWLNPNSEGNPYSWAEGPVMWKHDGFYFYSFAQHLVGAQYVMRSDTLTDNKEDWTIMNGSMFQGSRFTYNTPNHISPAVELDDGTSWVVAHSYNSASNWYAHGRQGLLCQVTYNENNFPVMDYPPNDASPAPALPSSGVPWMVPKSDTFDDSELKPEWSLLGFTPENTYSLTERPGWLYLQPSQGENTVIQNDGEHCYSLITRVEFEPESTDDEAGLWIFNGPELHFAKIFSTQNTNGQSILALSFQDKRYEVENTIGSTVWLKLTRISHMISGYYSNDGMYWTQIGEKIDVTQMDINQTDFNNFTGNQQGLFVNKKAAYFDHYIYKDAYSPVLLESAANHSGILKKNTKTGYVLDKIEENDWVMIAGMEFGNSDYKKTPDSLKITASCSKEGGFVEVWIDSLNTGTKIGECQITNTGSTNTYKTFTAPIYSPVSGSYDVYLKFTGSNNSRMFQPQYLLFVAKGDTTTDVKNRPLGKKPIDITLRQNYPNPFNPATRIDFSIPKKIICFS